MFTSKDKYRDRIYAAYGENIQDSLSKFDFKASLKWGNVRKYHLRNWLPENKESRIVDVACGGGMLLHFFITEGYKNIEGVDVSEDQVNLSKQIVNKVTHGDVIEFLKNNPNSFDLITGYDIVEHFYKDEVFDFLDATYNALRPNGRLILQTPNAGCPWGCTIRYGDFTHEVGFTKNVLSRIMRLVGYGDIEARECDPMPSGGSLISSIRYVLWRLIRFQVFIRNLIETGQKGDGICTRVFLISARKGLK